MTGRRLAVGTGLAAAALAGALSFAFLSGGADAPKGDAHPATPATGRLVVLSRTMPPPSTGTRLNAQLASGSVPAAGAEGTVLDDLDCTPDAAGISHCRNPVVLAGGKRVELVHPHSMAVVPCLTRGEHVRLVWG